MSWLERIGFGNSLLDEFFVPGLVGDSDIWMVRTLNLEIFGYTLFHSLKVYLTAYPWKSYGYLNYV